jgi:hypothetical protein
MSWRAQDWLGWAKWLMEEKGANYKVSSRGSEMHGRVANQIMIYENNKFANINISKH